MIGQEELGHDKMGWDVVWIDRCECKSSNVDMVIIFKCFNKRTTMAVCQTDFNYLQYYPLKLNNVVLR